MPSAASTCSSRRCRSYYAHFRVSNNLLELRNLLQVAELIVNCALQRKESRGLHYNLDYPDMQPDQADRADARADQPFCSVMSQRVTRPALLQTGLPGHAA